MCGQTTLDRKKRKCRQVFSVLFLLKTDLIKNSFSHQKTAAKACKKSHDVHVSEAYFEKRKSFLPSLYFIFITEFLLYVLSCIHAHASKKKKLKQKATFQLIFKQERKRCVPQSLWNFQHCLLHCEIVVFCYGEMKIVNKCVRSQTILWIKTYFAVEFQRRSVRGCWLLNNNCIALRRINVFLKFLVIQER